MRLNPVERWIAEHVGRILLVVLALMGVGAGVTLFLLVDEQTRLSGVTYAGPCRSQGIDNSECREQARLIFKACSDQPKRCARLYGIRVMPWARKAQRRTRRQFQANPNSAGGLDVGGGGAQNPSNPGQRPKPGPRPGGPAPRRPRPPSRPSFPPPVVDVPATPVPAPPPLPGAAGDTPGAGQGLKACVDLAVSACATLPALPTPRGKP